MKHHLLRAQQKHVPESISKVLLHLISPSQIMVVGCPALIRRFPCQFMSLCSLLPNATAPNVSERLCFQAENTIALNDIIHDPPLRIVAVI